KENRDRVVRFIAFEKSPQIADQAVRVDPSRGISLLTDQTTGELSSEQPGLEADNSSSRSGLHGSKMHKQTDDEIPISANALDDELNDLLEKAAINNSTTPQAEPTGVKVESESNLDEAASFVQWESDDLVRTDASEKARNEFFAMLDE